MDIEAGLNFELSNVTGLRNKVYPLSAPEGTATPYLTYELSSTGRLNNLSGFDGMVERKYELNILHTSYGSLKALMKSVIAKIELLVQGNIGVTGPYIQQIDIENEFETYQNDVSLYQGTIEITIYYSGA